jgi:hypothetical protein
MKLKLKISNNHIAIAGFAAVLLAAASLFGITGARTIASIAIFFFLPFHLIVRNLKIEADETIFFSFFIGLGLFSTIVFYAGRIIPSYRFSVVVAFVALLLVPVIIKGLKKRLFFPFNDNGSK